MSGDERPHGQTDRTSLGPQPPKPLASALARLRARPNLVVPFLLVGLVLSAIDWLRLRDPIPTIERGVPWGNGLSIDIELEYVGFPTGVPQTMTPLESLVDLHPEYLVWGFGLYLGSLVAITLAGAVTMGWLMDRAVRPSALGSLFGFVLAVDLIQRWFGSIDALQGMGLYGIVIIAFYLFVMVRLFAVPGLLVAGRRLWPAVQESDRLTRGRGWSLAGLIVTIGLSAWLLASVPVVGTLLSTALVAPIHAAAIVSLLEPNASTPPSVD